MNYDGVELYLVETKAGRRCQNGTLRNSRGICVSPDTCPKNITEDNNNYPYNYKPFQIRPMCKGGRYDEWLGSFTTYEPKCEQAYVRFVPLGVSILKVYYINFIFHQKKIIGRLIVFLTRITECDAW